MPEASAADNAKPETKNFFARRVFCLATHSNILFKIPREYQASVTEPFAPQTSALIRSKKICFSGEKIHEWSFIDCDSIYIAIGSVRQVWQRSSTMPKIIIHFRNIKVVIKIYPKLRSPASLICPKTTRN